MILTGVQGVHHVLGRDKDLVCPIKLAIKAVKFKKKRNTIKKKTPTRNKGNMESEISNVLSPS